MCVSAFARTKNHIWTTKRIYVEIELEEYKPKKEDEKQNNYEVLMDVSMSLDSVKIDPKTTSVIEYYSYFNKAIKKNKKARQSQKKGK